MQKADMKRLLCIFFVCGTCHILAQAEPVPVLGIGEPVIEEQINEQQIVLAHELDLTDFGGHVYLCPLPLIAHNNSCTCSAGWTWLGAKCVLCAAGYYKSEAGFGPCSSCGEHMTSFEGATESTECLCAEGFMESNNYCVACNATAYKAFIGNHSCITCRTRSKTKEGVNSQTDACVCEDGYSLQEEECVACPENFFSNDLTSNLCVACHANSLSNAASAACHCTAGFEQHGAFTCTECVPGTYSDGSDSVCKRCPDNMSSLRGSRDIASCHCEKGYERLSNNTCVLCSENFFCSGLDAKIACPQHSSSRTGAFTAESCMCDMGYYAYDNACIICGENFFCSDGTRERCPDNSASVRGSTHIDNCTCLSGFVSSV